MSNKITIRVDAQVWYSLYRESNTLSTFTPPIYPRCNQYIKVVHQIKKIIYFLYLKTKMVKKECSVLLLVALVAVIALLFVFQNAKNIHVLSLDENVIGQAVKALTGKTCGTSQKTLCQQQKNRCATMKGTWKGDCTTCTIKCEISKKK